MVSVLKQVGAQVLWENEDVTPLGKPDADRETDCAPPLSSDAVIMDTPELEGGSVTVPPCASEKSNAGGAGGDATGGAASAGAETGGAGALGGTAGAVTGASPGQGRPVLPPQTVLNDAIATRISSG